jgi:3-hydroxyisobutyrate dehydrogenase-like beta-hydroxyacid dehydrogenase
MANGQMTFFMGGDDASKAMAKLVLEPVAAGIYDLGKTWSWHGHQGGK